MGLPLEKKAHWRPALIGSVFGDVGAEECADVSADTSHVLLPLTRLSDSLRSLKFHHFQTEFELKDELLNGCSWMKTILIADENVLFRKK